MTTPFVVELTEHNFQQLIESSLNTPLLIHFWANPQPESVEIIPALQNLAQQYQGQMTLALLDCESQPAIAGQFGVQMLPTIALFVSGQPVDGLGGPQSIDSIRAMLAKHLPNPELQLLDQAKQLNQQGQFDSAQTILVTLSDEIRHHPEAKLVMAETLIGLEQIDAAKAFLEQIPLEYQDNYFESLVAKIALTQQAAESPELLELESAFAQNTNDLELRLELATLYHQAKRNEEALELLWQVLMTNLNVKDGEIKQRFMDILSALGQGDRVASTYRRKLYSLLY
ncbi:co-chaperone YbbN [Vibrio sp. SM6]|uniref:Co-chaperone YbbN n=1 Tax=Vibrio agarilyticus TaxID=2726741 RepID=A0A7X8TMQ7_9VIBR|nr:co-chaperone YbbN [Vibrio agarilyticus]NLS11607.1 co-chaperone YbbN [Vibrio agarilyticus]